MNASAVFWRGIFGSAYSDESFAQSFSWHMQLNSWDTALLSTNVLVESLSSVSPLAPTESGLRYQVANTLPLDMHWNAVPRSLLGKEANGL